MDLKEIKKILELMDEHELTFFHLEKEDFNIKLKKGMDAEAILAAMPRTVSHAPAPVASAPVALPAAASTNDVAIIDGKPILSPMVGTFYRKASPDAPNFVEIGSTVKEGDTICIIEAMKVMNEIKAEISGKVTAILADDSTPVQYGDTLFMVK